MSKLEELEDTVSENKRETEVCRDKLDYFGQVVKNRTVVSHGQQAINMPVPNLKPQHRSIQHVSYRNKAVSAPQQQVQPPPYLLFHESPMLSQIKEFVICSSTEKDTETPDEPFLNIGCDFDQDNGTTTDNDQTEVRNDPHFLQIKNYSAAKNAGRNNVTDDRRKSSPPPLSPFLIDEAFLKKEPLSIRKNINASRIEGQGTLKSLSKVKDFNDFQQLLKNLKSSLNFEGVSDTSKLTSLFDLTDHSSDNFRCRMTKLREKLAAFRSFLQREVNNIKSRNTNPFKPSSLADGSVFNLQQVHLPAPDAHSHEYWVSTLCQMEVEITYLQEKYLLSRQSCSPRANDDITRVESRLLQIEDQYRQVYSQVKMYFST